MKVLRTGGAAAIAGAIVLAGCLAVAGLVRAQAGDGPGPWKLAMGEEVAIDVASDPVTWRDSETVLVRLHRARFELDGAHLTATVTGGIMTFDDVDYDVSIAVYDDGGRLLGVARAVCRVPRIWLGRIGLTGREIEFDFGESLDFERAASFAVGISREKVLTPDDWQE